MQIQAAAAVCEDPEENLGTYFNVTLAGVPDGNPIEDGTFPGWCVEKDKVIRTTDLDWSPYGGNLYDTPIYSSLDPPGFLSDPPTNIPAETWSSINWILNSPKGNDPTKWAVTQLAIWFLLDLTNKPPDPYPYNCPLEGSALQAVIEAAVALADEAKENVGFVPGPGQDVALILPPTGASFDTYAEPSCTERVDDPLFPDNSPTQLVIIEKTCCSGTIGNYVWEDDGDGCQEDDKGIPGVEVCIYENADCQNGVPGEPKDCTFTDNKGFYLFTGLECGKDYEIKFTRPDDFVETLPNQECVPGDPDESDKQDSDCVEGERICVSLGTDGTVADLTIDCGYVPECGLELDKKCLVEPPADGLECTDKIVATTLSYIGPVITDLVTVKIDPDKGATAIFDFPGGLKSGDKIFIDARDSSEPELGSKTKIRINGVEEVIHTSCSTPYVAGQPAPLDDPKGAPSPNWFVENFVDKDSPAVVAVPFPIFSDSCTATLQPDPSCQVLKDTGQKLTSITFQYTGGGCIASANTQDPSKATCEGSIDPALSITVASSNGYSIDPATVDPGGEFTVSTGSFDSNSIFTLGNAGGTETDQIHTSCSQPLAVGDVFGSLTVAAINGARGGAEVTYLYAVTNNGPALTGVSLVDDPLGMIDDDFDIGAGATLDFTKTTLIDETTTNIATVSALEGECQAQDSVTVTVTEPCDVCKGGTVELIFQYLGAAAANVVVYDDNDAKADKILFQGTVSPNEQFTITPRPGEDKLNNDISIWVEGVFSAKVHTSCSQPLFPGLVFGDFQVVEARSKDNGLICAPDCDASPDASLEINDRTVKWEFTNNGNTSLVLESVSICWPDLNGALKKIKLDGDIFKDALLDPLCAALPADALFVGTVKNREIEPGETRKLEFEFVNDASTDQGDYGITVVFAGNGCSFEFVPGAAPTVCTTKIQAMKLRYIGPSISNATVEFDPDKSPTVVYSNVNLDSGVTILIDSQTENGFTVDAQPDEAELGAKTKIYIDEVEEVIHTSCSTPFVAGAPAPLDDPKGDPSPNWFVESFVQKP